MCSVIELPENQINVLERFQNECLRSFLGLPVSTHGSLLRLISGVEPLGARFDILKLGYYSRISSKFDKNRAVYSIVSNDFESLISGDISKGVEGSFAGSIRRIFTKLDCLVNFEFPCSSNTTLKIKIWNLYHAQDISRIYSSKQSQLFYSLYKNQTVGRVRSNRNPYQILPIGTSMFLGEERSKRSVLIKIISGVGFLNEYLSPKFQKLRKKKCPFCESEIRNLQHYCFECPKFKKLRSKYVKVDSLCQLFDGNNIKNASEYLQQISVYFE